MPAALGSPFRTLTSEVSTSRRLPPIVISAASAYSPVATAMIAKLGGSLGAA